MKVQHGNLSEIDRYLEHEKSCRLEDRMPEFERYLRYIGKVRKPNPDIRILEIGVGTGWFPLLCKARGLQCKGLEISPQLLQFAMELGRANGIVPDVELGNVEETDLGVGQYDVIVASSVFEHVEDWRAALRKVYAALRPGGMLFFESTNKFSFVSGEYRGVPLYGWLPDALRYRLRVAVHGPDVMKLGIDFNQFTYFGLRRAFKKVGFKTILDMVDLADLERLVGWKRSLMAAGQRSGLMKRALLCFVEATTFVCVK